MRRGVKNPEHVADHMYMMAVMTFFIQDDHNLNKERYETHKFFLVKVAMILLHMLGKYLKRNGDIS